MQAISSNRATVGADRTTRPSELLQERPGNVLRQENPRRSGNAPTVQHLRASRVPRLHWLPAQLAIPARGPEDENRRTKGLSRWPEPCRRRSWHSNELHPLNPDEGSRSRSPEGGGRDRAE